jgi:hypothetical protein
MVFFLNPFSRPLDRRRDRLLRRLRDLLCLRGWLLLRRRREPLREPLRFRLLLLFFLFFLSSLSFGTSFSFSLSFSLTSTTFFASRSFVFFTSLFSSSPFPVVCCCIARNFSMKLPSLEIAKAASSGGGGGSVASKQRPVEGIVGGAGGMC